MSNNKKQVSNKIQKITFKDYKTDEIKQHENFYYIAFGLTSYSKEITIANIKTLYKLIKNGSEIFELYKKDILCRFQFDIDGIKELNDIHKLLICYNDIINDEDINDIYNNTLNKTFKIDILCYGEFEKEAINDIIKLIPNFNEHLNVHYEQKKKELSGKSFSTHISLNCYILHEYFTNNLHPYNLSLTNTTKSINIELDNTIYKEFGILRASSSDKTTTDKDKNDGTYKKYKTGIKIDDFKEFKRQFLQYPKTLTEEQKQAYIKIADIITNKYINRDNKTNNKEQTNNKTTTKKQQDKTKEENIKELPTKKKEKLNKDVISTPVPLGIIEEILMTYFPKNVHFHEFIPFEEGKGDKYYRALSGFITNCPYKYEDIKDIIYKYWNQTDIHNKPNKLNNWVIDNIKYNNTAKYFFSFLKIFNDYETFDEYIINKEDFDYNLYVKYYNKSKSSKKLNKDEFKQYETLKEQYNEIKIEYNKRYEKTHNAYKKYLKIFKTYQIFTTKRTTEDLTQNDYYIDVNTNKVMLKAYDEYDISFNQTGQAEFKSAYDIDLKKVIKTNEDIYKKLLYTYTYTTETNYKNADRMLEIFKEGFKHETDYVIFLDFIREKLNNPSYMYPINFANYGGKDSLKTTFINIIKKYHDVSILNPNKIISIFNTEFLSSIVMIDELPIRVQDNQKAIENIKIHTLGDSFEVEAKGKDKKCVKNRSNIVINTNHKEIGGLFDYQEDGEMFKRFYVIEKQTITKPHINEFIKLMKDEANTKALIERIKTLTPLTDEQRDNRETQQEYYNFVKNNKNKRNVLSLSKIDDTIRTDKNGKKWVKTTELIYFLKINNVITSAQTERQLLEKEDIIKTYSNRTCYIKDINKYYETYYLIECDDDTEYLNEHLKKLKEEEQKKQQQKEEQDI